MIEKYLKNKGIGAFLCALAAILGIITAIIFLATQAEASPVGHVAGPLGGVLLIIASVLMIALYFFPVRFGALVGVVLYTISFTTILTKIYYFFADMINGVTYAGGQAGLCLFYLIGSLLCTVLCVVACFFPQNRDGSELI